MKQFNLEEYLKNPERKIVTRDGRAVKRILCTDVKGKYPIVVVIENRDGNTEQAISLTKDGKYCDDISHKNDLFFAAEKHEGWINIFEGISGRCHVGSNISESKENAEKDGKVFNDYVATIKIEWGE